MMTSMRMTTATLIIIYDDNDNTYSGCSQRQEVLKRALNFNHHNTS